MKLILASEGFYTEEIVAKCEELVGKPRHSINIAIINEGYAVQSDNLRWVLVNLNDVVKNFGGKLELVNLLALDKETVKERIEEADVLFVVGGDADYLMTLFNKTGFTQLLPELLQKKVYVGSSAGSMVMGKRLPTNISEKLYHLEAAYTVEKYMELVDFSFVAHLNSQSKDRQAKLIEATKDKKNLTVYGLHDDSAIVIDGGSMTVIGSKPLMIIK
ncbi:MAG: Type 1 glutamine amidotransferase-like domain-containing protein [Patescibacteria group bacterium]